MRRSPLLAVGAVTLCSCLFGSLVTAQDIAPSDNPRVVSTDWHALTGARVMTSPGTLVENATIVIRDGRIVSVTAYGPIPDGARRHDLGGRLVHAAFIDAFVPVEVEAPDPDAPGSHWHPSVTPQRSALDGAGLAGSTAEQMRELGFGAASIHPDSGIFRGRSGVVTLEELEGDRPRRVLSENGRQLIAFDRAESGYPRSAMGIQAMVRQTLSDAGWDRGRSVDRVLTSEAATGSTDSALAALRAGHGTTFLTRSELELLDALRISREFAELTGEPLLVGSGTEFRRLDQIAEAGLPIVLPVDFPAAPDVFDRRSRDAMSLRQMWTWEQAPTNPVRLASRGVEMALTTWRLDRKSSFLDRLQEAIEAGLTDEQALAALTTVPAKLLGIDRQVGTVEPGKIANLCVVDGALFGEERTLRSIWIGGVEHRLEKPKGPDLDGEWTADFGDGITADTIQIDGGRVEIVKGETSVRAKARRSGAQVEFVFEGAEFGVPGKLTLSALARGRKLHGIGDGPDGTRFAWTASRKPAEEGAADEVTETEPTEEEAGPDADLATRDLPVPFGAFGRTARPEQRSVAVRNTTLWTSGPDGVIENATLIVVDGKVLYAGPNDSAPEIAVDLEIDGRGKHVTPGLIDCHSHTGIRGGVNEGTQTVTSEVRIGDVLDPDDVNWYRQLAGGITLVNQLHGSANPIGGQNQVVKLRWGAGDPEAMKLEGSKPGIKFALGENVKRSRSSRNTRYPNTRMGVEAVLRDRFEAAKDYMAAFERFESGASTEAPRRDLELEAIAEILRGERLIHCHSYRQDEILMLCRLADEFGFKIGTLQHGLEAYKVADAVKQSSLGASIFTDWWAYKYEVVDAIPEAGAILHEVGVVVSFNSDSSELARRMNTEATKAVKYGGVDPAEALKMVTLNPAIQLAIGDRVGSLEKGKDGDFVLWSGDPLSGFSRCLETWIEGRREWSETEDLTLRAAAQAERMRLIQKLLARGERGGSRGADADGMPEMKPGDCGCSEETVEAIERVLLMQREGQR